MHDPNLGVSNYPHMPLALRLAVADACNTCTSSGRTGVGKSTLLANLVGQDIAAGYGVVVNRSQERLFE